MPISQFVQVIYALSLNGRGPLNRDSIGDMKTTSPVLLFAALLVLQHAQAQQPSPQPAQPQPCATTSTTPSGNNPAIKVPNKWQQMINKKLQKIENQTGIPVSDVATDVAQAGNSKQPAPCPTQAVPPKNPPPTPAPALKPPPDVTTTTTLHCNPMTPSTSGHPTTLTLPDPHEFAVPKPTDWLVDAVVPDLAAHAPCFQVKVDPKSGKSFLSQ
jgi:hypothetical protein